MKGRKLNIIQRLMLLASSTNPSSPILAVGSGVAGPRLDLELILSLTAKKRGRSSRSLHTGRHCCSAHQLAAMRTGRSALTVQLQPELPCRM
eukprot:CAMPEP_0173318322 /NCGR_PEP_ID=MMETSP1143-20121109/27593_1 /TAXON_ID=483371 /ORGANISM="non described non described, Strain CCMP2298" /LENGTH=91 /DNA_ID=CAMNT_0014261555 /DNA_START=872 /DNA_END=1144 /DNA_ORIENTATION=-